MTEGERIAERYVGEPSNIKSLAAKIDAAIESARMTSVASAKDDGAVKRYEVLCMNLKHKMHDAIRWLKSGQPAEVLQICEEAIAALNRRKP
jgi:hypothetical protein